MSICSPISPTLVASSISGTTFACTSFIILGGITPPPSITSLINRLLFATSPLLHSSCVNSGGIESCTRFYISLSVPHREKYQHVGKISSGVKQEFLHVMKKVHPAVAEVTLSRDFSVHTEN